MMKLFYTGAKLPNGDQAIGHLSTGGYISQTEVQLTDSPLFGEFAGSDLNGGFLVRCLALTNDTNATINNISIFFEGDDFSNLLKSGFTWPALNTSNQPMFENTTGKSLPMSVVEWDFPTLNSPQVITSLQAGKSIGIWLRLTLSEALAELTSVPKIKFVF